LLNVSVKKKHKPRSSKSYVKTTYYITQLYISPDITVLIIL